MLDLILLQKGSAGADGGGMMMWLPLILIFGIFMWMSWSSQRKEKKRQATFYDSLTVGAKVMTKTGVIGKIKAIKPDTVELEIADGVKITVLKQGLENMPANLNQAKDAKK